MLKGRINTLAADAKGPSMRQGEMHARKHLDWEAVDRIKKQSHPKIGECRIMLVKFFWLFQNRAMEDQSAALTA